MRFEDKVVYQIYPKSFQDSDGDGWGDINGIRSRIDYLAGLGVDYLWLTPFFTSPQRDNGYDVADYRAVDLRFGTMADLEALIAEAEMRGIGLMFDMVFNHTSTAHEWFQKALQGDAKYMDYYIFRDGTPDAPPTNWQSKFGGSAWEYVPHLGKWYLHLFDVTQADLNWENPAVREELKDILRFWKAKGVKGFRFDVVNLISKGEFVDDNEGDGRRFYTDGPHVHEYLKELVHDSSIEGMVTVGEMSSTTIANCIRYTNPAEHELSMTFSFHHLKVDYKDGDKWSLMAPDIHALKEIFASWQEGMARGGGWNAVFWCNHDQPRIVSRLGDAGRYWKESAKMLAAAIHLMRGTPYIYQGEEIGMTNADFTDISDYRDVESINYHDILRASGQSEEETMKIIRARSRDNGRTPMQWTAGESAGFTTGTPWLGVNRNHAAINVEAEREDDDSILAFYRRLIALRKEHRIIAEGSIRFLERENDEILAYERELEGEHLLVLCNFRASDIAMPELHAAGEKFIGNYPGMAACLRPYEVVALRWVE
ncbi:alpha,alpha-phosphotrehalase [Mitsuokella jalaludinii]|uniref:alpha,alpha-phosphotrehalase n=1 Tax=Mitsuokella jalaludinii TaxID=187979 RepID=UPI0024322FBA|nr:alpha,alpha-phosphotrehalase [Mitsuokella jalaludinii]MCI6611775.1 alpha,alpha-phosphotrehalase [Mitsuokella jalaludinii]MCI7715701.1 alpha,alpha-phosphotrehalase [Mitsuokella jalaludinii]